MSPLNPTQVGAVNVYKAAIASLEKAFPMPMSAGQLLALASSKLLIAFYEGMLGIDPASKS